MSSTSPSPRPARQRKMTAKAQEMLDLDEYINSDSEVVESYADEVSMQDSETDHEQERCVDVDHKRNDKAKRKTATIDLSGEEDSDCDEAVSFASDVEKGPEGTRKVDSVQATPKDRHEDLAEVVIETTSPKKKSIASPRSPPASPLKKLSISSGKVPISPQKRKRAVERTTSPDSDESQVDSDLKEEKIVLAVKAKSAGEGSPKKSRLQSQSPSPSSRKPVKNPSTPKGSRAAKPVSSPSSPSKANGIKSKDNSPVKKDEGQNKAENGGSTRKQACVWTEEETDRIGQVYMQAINALVPSAFKAGLEDIWAEDESLTKTSQDIKSHLRKWKKLYQTATSSMTDG